MDGEHPIEREPDFLGMALSGPQIGDLRRCQGMAFPVRTVARSAPAGAASGIGWHT
jgi:hypothetical protein